VTQPPEDLFDEACADIRTECDGKGRVVVEQWMTALEEVARLVEQILGRLSHGTAA
jgi:hypothetical protein